MNLRNFLSLFPFVLACGESASQPQEAPTDGDAAVDCDPRRSSKSSSGSAAAGSGGHASGEVGVDLGGGSSMPAGRTLCGAEHMINCGDTPKENGLICCRLKNECYNPEKEPDFCERPYCKD